jgi:hypothetical protein
VHHVAHAPPASRINVPRSAWLASSFQTP